MQSKLSQIFGKHVENIAGLRVSPKCLMFENRWLCKNREIWTDCFGSDVKKLNDMNVIILISKHPSLYNHLTLCDRGRSVREHLDYLSMNINTLGFKGVQSVQVRSRPVVDFGSPADVLREYLPSHAWSHWKRKMIKCVSGHQLWGRTHTLCWKIFWICIL